MFHQIIQDLNRHFNNIEINPPATDNQINDLKQLFPDVHDEVISFYKTCNGFSATDDVDGHIYSIDEIFSSYPVILDSDEYPLIKTLCPIRSDGCGDYDCILISKEKWNGSVVFWDHEVYDLPSYILGGTFHNYLTILKEYLMTCFNPQGELLPEYNDLLDDGISEEEMSEFPWPFDTDWLINRDKKAKELLENSKFRKVLEEQDE